MSATLDLWGLELKSASLARLVLLTSIVGLLLDLARRKLRGWLEFRRQIDRLPGPKASNVALGNIPASVLGLLFNVKRSAKTDAKTHAKQAGDDFYLSQIQSVLGHTLIYEHESLYRLWIGQEAVVCVWKPEVVEQVLGDNFLLEKSYHYDFLRPWLGDGLLTSPGRIWRPRRKLLVPSFHFNILQAFVPVFDRKSRVMVRNLKRRVSRESTVADITPIITACTLDAICETIMGVQIDAQESTGPDHTTSDNDYCESIYVVGETFLERIIQPRYWLDFVFYRTKLGKLYSRHLDKLHSFTRRVIREKKAAMVSSKRPQAPQETAPSSPNSLASRVKLLAESSVDSFVNSTEGARPQLPKAFLDLLLDRLAGAKSAGNLQLSDEQIREEVDTFMFEGHDTTAMALSWCLFLLGHHPHELAKVQREVDELFRDELEASAGAKLELEHLKRLKYLDCVIKEALRLCPSVPFIGRKTTRPLELGGHRVPSGAVVFVLIYQLHRNPRVFPQPERFRPERFLPENTLGRHPFAYVPFSAGARNCIGQKFAMAEMKTILCHLIRNFSFESVTPMDKTRVHMEMVLRPKCELNIRIKQRIHE